MTDGRLLCNRVSIYYRTIGTGKPLIFLHGNGEDGTLFIEIAEKLSEQFCVYLVDSRAHGNSGDAPLSYSEMAEDIAVLIRMLRLSKPAVYGFSDGGIVALMLAMRYPGLTSKLAVSGVNLNPRALKRGFRLSVRIVHFFTRDKKLKLMLKEPNITLSDLAKITEPVWVLAGERDIVTRAHTEAIAEAIGVSHLHILKGENHASYVRNNAKLNQVLQEFFV